DETKPNSTLDQFIRKGYNDMVLPMAAEMLPKDDMTEDDIFDQTSNWARGMSYVHNIFSWPATDPYRLALDRYFVNHIGTAEALVTSGQQLAYALAATECVQMWRQEHVAGLQHFTQPPTARDRPDDALSSLASIPEALMFRLLRLVYQLQSGSTELDAAVRGSEILMSLVSERESVALSASEAQCERVSGRILQCHFLYERVGESESEGERETEGEEDVERGRDRESERENKKEMEREDEVGYGSASESTDRSEIPRCSDTESESGSEGEYEASECGYDVILDASNSDRYTLL
ncbi:hypothetical protein KIPB_014089, partial [Kipferlia bialata]